MTRVEAYGQRSLTPVDRLGVWLSRRRIAKVLARLSGTADISALDLGCGFAATHLMNIRPLIAEGTGIDVAIDPRLRELPGLTFIEETVENAMPALGEDAYSLVLFNSVLEHLKEPLEALQHCHRVLQPGGILLVNVPTWRGKVFLEYSAFKLGTSPAYEMDDHKMYYDRRDLWPLLVKAGFKPSLIKMYYHKFGLNLFAECQKEAGSTT